MFLRELLLSPASVRTYYRGIILFAVGVFFTFIFRILQLQRKQGVLNSHFTTAFLCTLGVSTMTGTLSVLIGLLYPHLNRSGHSWALPVDWASVMRCIVIYMGINQANAVSLKGIFKLDFANNLHLSLTLAGMSVGLWWLFDRSQRGFGLGLSTALIATTITQLLTYSALYKYIERDFFNLRYHAYSWLPYIFFAAGITIGNLGRQLANHDVVFDHKPNFD
uniref:Uncharacterized protein n=1 Tax=Strigamia maritima TaxID=126957 RepID=T1JCX2_STRMM